MSYDSGTPGLGVSAQQQHSLLGIDLVHCFGSVTSAVFGPLPSGTPKVSCSPISPGPTSGCP